LDPEESAKGVEQGFQDKKVSTILHPSMIISVSSAYRLMGKSAFEETGIGRFKNP